jgi:hypothetical protein
MLKQPDSLRHAPGPNGRRMVTHGVNSRRIVMRPSKILEDWPANLIGEAVSHG